MKKTKGEGGQITPEEKEMLKRLMETPGIENEWDFFEDLNPQTPPPEFFMQGDPEPRFARTRKVLKAGAYVASVLICAVVLANFMIPVAANADKTPFQILVDNIKNGFAVSKPEGESMEDFAFEVIIDDEENVRSAGRKVFPELLVPGYVEETYHFNELIVRKDSTGNLTATYLYKNSQGETLKIAQYQLSVDSGTAFNNLTLNGEELEIGKLYYQHDEMGNNNMMTVWLGESERIVIAGSLDEAEMKKVLEGLK